MYSLENGLEDLIKFGTRSQGKTKSEGKKFCQTQIDAIKIILCETVLKNVTNP
jgi:hypothetical protein